MSSLASPVRKRPVNLTLNEELVIKARAYTGNLSATMESLLAEFVANQQKQHQAGQNAADICADDWNGFHQAVGSFADEHSTL